MALGFRHSTHLRPQRSEPACCVLRPAGNPPLWGEKYKLVDHGTRGSAALPDRWSLRRLVTQYAPANSRSGGPDRSGRSWSNNVTAFCCPSGTAATGQPVPVTNDNAATTFGSLSAPVAKLRSSVADSPPADHQNSRRSPPHYSF